MLTSVEPVELAGLSVQHLTLLTMIFYYVMDNFDRTDVRTWCRSDLLTDQTKLCKIQNGKGNFLLFEIWRRFHIRVWWYIRWNLKLLGVTLASSLLCNSHVSTIYKIAYYHLKDMACFSLVFWWFLLISHVSRVHRDCFPSKAALRSKDHWQLKGWIIFFLHYLLTECKSTLIIHLFVCFLQVLIKYTLHYL